MKRETRYEPMRKLKAMRALKGLTIAQLAEKANINRNTIGDYERGLRVPRIVALRALAEALECDIQDII